jgi:biopolymer transport protein ExbD
MRPDAEYLACSQMLTTCRNNFNLAMAAMVLTLITALAVGWMPVCVRGIYVDLPRSTTATYKPGWNRIKSMEAAVTRDGHIFFETSQLENAVQMTALLREGMENDAPHRLYIHADSRARYQTVKEVLDAAGDAGIRDITFITETRRY